MEKPLSWKILKHLGNMSDAQLSERLRKKCAEFNGSREELQQLFDEIYNSCCESSSFVKAVVDPKFTKNYE